MPLLMSSTFAPMENGDYLWLGQDHGQNLKEIARHSKHDADAYNQYAHDMEMVCQAIKPLLDTAPPDLFSDDPEELLALAALGSRFRKMDKRTLHNAVRLLTGSAADFLDDYFESDILKGYLASSSDHRDQGRAALAGLRARAALPLDRRARRRVRGVGVPQGRQRRVHPGAGPRGAVVRGRDRARIAGRARSSPRTAGRPASPSRTAPSTTPTTVVSALDPRRTFLELVDPRELPADLVENIRRFRFQGTSSKVNFALDGLPQYPALPGRGDQFRGFTNIGPSMDYLERAYDDAKYGWYSQRPYIDCAIQSTIDSGHGAARQARDELVHPVHAVQAARERLGHRAAEPGRHRPGDARVVLPGLRRARPPARGRDPARHRADRRPVARATSSPASSWRPQMYFFRPGARAGASTARRSTATTSAAPARIRAAASWARRASSPPNGS